MPQAVLKTRLHALGTLAAAPLLALLAGAPSTSWALLSDPHDPTAPLVGAVAMAAWACTAWLTLLVALVWGTRVPGVLGRVAGRVAARIAPAGVRGLVRVALGTTVALAVLGGSSSAFAETRPVTSSSFEWPGASAPAPSDTSLDWPSPVASAAHAAPAHAAPAHAPAHTPAHAPSAPAPATAPAAAPAAAPVVAAPAVHAPAVHAPAVHARTAAPGTPVGGTVVRQGDSLWRIAARSLGRDATAAQVAQSWPQWWSANRAVIGDHPDLIHPGDHLAAPRH